MKKEQGFTLIELVVVIVILGILAVTAAPKFMNLQGDARKASLEGLKGSMEGAAGIIYGKAAIAGIESQSLKASDAEVKENFKVKVALTNGYPAATKEGIGAVVNGLVDATSNDTGKGDWKIVSGGDNTDATTAPIVYSFNNKGGKPTCAVEYTPSVSGAAPVVKVNATEC